MQTQNNIAKSDSMFVKAKYKSYFHFVGNVSCSHETLPTKCEYNFHYAFTNMDPNKENSQPKFI